MHKESVAKGSRGKGGGSAWRGRTQFSNSATKIHTELQFPISPSLGCKLLGEASRLFTHYVTTTPLIKDILMFLRNYGKAIKN